MDADTNLRVPKGEVPSVGLQRAASDGCGVYKSLAIAGESGPFDTFTTGEK